jgi:hypothetical protein
MLKVFNFSAILLFIVSFTVIAQEFSPPRPSPDATVTQYVGVTEIKIDYSSPGVKERKIWGELVPFGKVWRTGANEVTSITFSDPVKVNGNELPAGTYGIHIIPNENEWEIIFSKDTEIDGSSAYDETKDALKLKVEPEDNPFTERMMFTITDMTDNSAKVNLIWEKLKISFGVEVDTYNLTLQNARNSFDWGSLMAAANYCLQQNNNIEEGYKWIQASVLIEENYWNSRILAQYFAKMEMKNEAVRTMEKAVEMGSQMEQPPFDFDNMKKMLEEWKSN